MSEEEKDETTENEAPEAAEEAPAAEAAPAEETPAEEAPAADEAPAAEEAPAEEAPAEEPAAEEAPAEAPAAESEPTPAPEADAEPEEQLGPKERRRRERSAHSGEAAPERSVEERAAERAERRRANRAARSRTRIRSRSKREPREGTPPAEHEAGSKQERQGTVVSDKADKTITVRIDVVRRHPRYEKVLRRSATVHAHDERNEANAGDRVRLVESRPLSRTKRWRLVEVLERAR